MIPTDLIRETARLYYQKAIELRRHFHKHPELSFKEEKTSGYIAVLLKELGVDFVDNIAGTGIIASLKGRKGPGPVIALRAELDALPVTEATGLACSSIYPGIMHACGHDAHLAMLLASLMTLRDLSDKLTGEVLFIFQPGEELAPGGASLIMKEGTLVRKNPAAIIAQHVFPELDAGKVGFRSGPYMASSDELYIEITGKGGHAALPENYTDQILAGSTLVSRLKQKVNELDQGIPKILAIGTFTAKGATNVIPDSAKMEGTIRTFNEETRKKIHTVIREESRAVEAEFGVMVKEDIRQGYPVLVNDTWLADIFSEVATGIHGSKNVEQLDQRMSSEDFSFYSEKFPVFFYRLGVGSTASRKGQLHTCDFDIEDSALLTGIETMCAMATRVTEMLHSR